METTYYIIVVLACSIPILAVVFLYKKKKEKQIKS